ncbi:hypothetical protein BD626DRAFT_534721 [Schizophyllum amplum]|uniref:F-box domain-containing protein n=1 Tax=Schizophyllum amplum TaxID=97359 RepID=A0A550CNY4_9AGAR|nr:hypothetical protein BD626DRAFT_534721 [Auriculariopsis ampla]
MVMAMLSRISPLFFLFHDLKWSRNICWLTISQEISLNKLSMVFGDRKKFHKAGLSSLFSSLRVKGKKLAFFPLLNLPYELLERIIMLSNPLDIMSLRQRHPLNFGPERRSGHPIWLPPLRPRKRFQTKNGVVLPAEPLRDRPIKDLERLSLQPALFRRRLRDLGQGADAQLELWPAAHCLMRDYFHNDEKNSTFLMLVAGGRFLFAQRENFRRNDLLLIQLSDASEISEEATTIAQTTFPEGTHTGRMQDYWRVKHSGNVLRLATLEILTTERLYQISIYEIDTAAEQPVFALIARTSDFGNITAMTSEIKHCGESRISLCDHKSLLLWDFARDERIFFDIPGPPNHYDYVLPHIKVVDDRVIYFQRHRLAIYAIPRGAKGHLGKLKPSFELKLPHLTNVYFPHPATPRDPFVFHVHNRSRDSARTYALSRGSGVLRAGSARSMPHSGAWGAIWGPAPFVACAGAHVIARISPLSCRYALWIDDDGAGGGLFGGEALIPGLDRLPDSAPLYKALRGQHRQT